jgi:hypothetical protein
MTKVSTKHMQCQAQTSLGGLGQVANREVLVQIFLLVCT